jgi:hypothetical protein
MSSFSLGCLMPMALNMERGIVSFVMGLHLLGEKALNLLVTNATARIGAMMTLSIRGLHPIIPLPTRGFGISLYRQRQALLAPSVTEVSCKETAKEITVIPVATPAMDPFGKTHLYNSRGFCFLNNA